MTAFGRGDVVRWRDVNVRVTRVGGGTFDGDLLGTAYEVSGECAEVERVVIGGHDAAVGLLGDALGARPL